jgi:TP901 family phage tail tape measure protein
VQANFDAAITLDIGPFIQSITKAREEIGDLSKDIDAINKKTLQISKAAQSTVSPSASSAVSPGAGLRERKEASKQLTQEIEQTKKLNQSRDDSVRNIARERYALYDVAATYQMINKAAVGALVGMSQAAISYEKAFANVIRTTEDFFTSAKIGAAANAAKFALRELAAEIPVTFQDLTQIATIGNQLGIAEGSIIAFTETVSKFASATGMTVESTAMSFGRIGELLNVPASEFEKMGSSIAFAGVRAVATEEQIVSVTREISTTAKMAKFTTPEIIGLSTAMSSLGIAPEMARGAIIRNFARINQAISEGGEKLEGYAKVAGMSAEAFSYEWQKNGEVAFNSFLQGLQKISDEGGNLDTVLRDIGLVNVRDIQVIQKLGDNYDVYASSIRDANQGFEEGTFLADAYGVTQDTVAARLQVIQNIWENLTASIGDAVISDEFKFLLDFVTNVLKRFDEMARSPLGKGMMVLAGVLLAVASALAAINGISALARASMLAYATAMGVAKVNTKGLVVGLNGAAVAAKIFNTTVTAIKAFAVIAAITIAVQELSKAFTSLEERAENVLGGFSGLQDALTDDFENFNTALSELGGDVSAAENATGVIAGMSTEIENNNSEVNNNITAQNALNGVLGLTSGNANLLSTEFETLNFVIGENTIAWVKNAIAQSDSFREMAKNTEVMKAIAESGFTVEDALAAAASGNMDEYIDDITAAIVPATNLVEEFVYELYNFGDSMAEFTSGWGVLGDVITGLAWYFGKSLNLMIGSANDFFQAIGLPSFLPLIEGVEDFGKVIQGLGNQMSILGPRARQAKKDIDGFGDSGDDAGEKLEGLGKQIRTVVDYANDLRGVFSRAFEIRFGQQQSLDDIAKGWNRISDEAERAREAVADANAEINELTVDRSILEYQLGVAERYKDERRAASIRARLAKIDGSMAKATEKLADNTAKLSRETDGSSKEAIENRAAILGQLGAYSSLIEMYSKTGLKGAELEAKVDELKASFLEQGLQAGYSREALLPYIKSFDDMKEAIQKTPRRVDVEFNSNVSPATQAVNEYLAKINAANKTVETKFITRWDAEPQDVQRAINAITYLQEDRRKIQASGRSTAEIDRLISQARAQLVLLRGYAKGGYVDGFGTSTSDSIPAMLSKGEYVIKASAVGAYGVDFMNALNEQKVGTFTSPGSGQQSSGGSSVIHLSPEDRSLLRAAIDRPVNLYTENSKIASSANAGNVTLAQRGAR